VCGTTREGAGPDSVFLLATNDDKAKLSISANADNSLVARNAFAGYFAWAVNLGIGLVVTPILLHRLGVEGFGIWTLSVTIAGYVALVESGLGVATVRQVAAALAVGDNLGASVVAASARGLYLVLAALGIPLLAGLVMIPRLVESTGHAHVAQMRLAVFVLGLGFLLSLATSIYPTLAVAVGRVDIGIAAGLASRLLMTAVQIAVVLVTTNIVALALVTAAGGVAGMLAVRLAARRLLRQVETKLALARRGTAFQLLRSGWRNAAIVVAAAVALQSDTIVVGAMIGAAAVAGYGVAVRAATAAIELSTRPTEVLVPTFAHAGALDDRKRIRDALTESILLSRAALVAALITFVAFGQSLLTLWLGTVPGNTNAVLTILVLGAIVSAPGHSCFVFLSGIGKLNYLLAGASLAAVGNLALSILLTWQLGVIGPALGTLLAWTVWQLLLLPRYVGRLVDMPWHQLSAAGLRVLAVPAFAASVTAWVLRHGLAWGTPGESLAGSLITALVYGAILVATLGAERRTRYLKLTRGAVGRVSRAQRLAS
jgi:O-antigen/teichoic acid export membrane protein